MRKKAFISILVICVLILCFPLESNEKNQKRFDGQTEFLPHSSANPISKLSGEHGPLNSAEYRRLIIHNINTDLNEIALLRARGWSESEIQTKLNADRATSGTGSISGVLYEKGSDPIKYNASVYAFDEFGHYCGYDSVYPSGDGHYQITNLAPGKYFVRLESFYYLDKYYRNTTSLNKAKLVRVRNNKETRRINFILVSPEGECSISGQVSRRDWASTANCRISVRSLSEDIVRTVSADETGQYLVQDLPAGDYKVQCTYVVSNVFVSIWYDNAYNFDEASIVKATKNEAMANIDFNLDSGGTIKGKVVGSNGKYVGSHECLVTAYDEKETNIRSTRTEAGGEFIMPDLPKGKYRLRILYYGQENNLSSWYKKGKKFKAATPIPVTPSKTKNVRIKLQQGGVITGAVTDYNSQPMAGNCVVYATDENREYSRLAWTDENGGYRIQGLSSGRHKLYAMCVDLASVPGQQPANEWYKGKYSYTEASWVKVRARKTKANINFSLKPGGYITGTAVLPDGQSEIFDWRILAYNLQHESIGYGDVGDDGLYCIAGLPSGEYKLATDYEGEENYLNEWYDNESTFVTAEPVNVTVPNMTGSINFALEYPGIVQGLVKNKKGDRLISDSHDIWVYAFDAETGEFADSAHNTFAGGYQLELLRGKYKIAVVSSYASVMSGFNDLALTFYPKGKSFNDPKAKTVSAVPGSVSTLNPLVMESATGSVSGTIYDKNTGLPIDTGSCMVRVFDENGYLAGDSTYYEFNDWISGDYYIGGLRPGQYYLLLLFKDDDDRNFFYSTKIQAQWNNGVEIAHSGKWIFTAKREIPAAASAINVGSGDTGGIDFYLDLAKEK